MGEAKLNIGGSAKENWTKENLTPDEVKLLNHQGDGFDLRTHIVNPRTGECIRQQAYRYVVDKSDAQHTSYYIRDGKRYSESGKLLEAARRNSRTQKGEIMGGAAGPVQAPASRLIAYTSKGKAPAFPVSLGKQLYVYNARSYNNSGSAQNVGICKIHNGQVANVASNYALWTLTTGGTVYTNNGSVLVGNPTIFTTTNLDGFIIQDKGMFNVIGMTVSQASTGSPVYTYKYWNGSAFTTLTTLETAVYSSTGDVYIAFQSPPDWVAGGPSQLDQTQFSIQVIASTAPTQAVQISALWVLEFMEFYQAVANNAAVQLSFPDTKPVLLKAGEGLCPYFATANSANSFGAFYVPAD